MIFANIAMSEDDGGNVLLFHGLDLLSAQVFFCGDNGTDSADDDGDDGFVEEYFDDVTV